MRCRFKAVIVIGCGKIAGDVLRYVAERQAFFGYRAVCVEHEVHGMARLRSICEETGAAYEQMADNGMLTQYLMNLNTPALVISAGNYYLFPKAVVEKPDLEIINFHNALLPKFPGRNAQSWALYEGETVTGATWHYVTADVDSGAIIAQSEVPISTDVKAYELTKGIMDAAFASFTAFFTPLMERHLEGTPQPKTEGKRKIYYSHEIPNGGTCDINDEPETIYRLLRAVDYGKSDIFPPVRLTLPDGTTYHVVRYTRKENTDTDGRNYVLDRINGRLYLPLPDGYELAIRLK